VSGDDKTLLATSVPSNDPTAPMTRESGELGNLGGYELGELLGRGGMGEVVLAHDPRVEREVALKRMRGKRPGPEAVARFIREAKIQARLDHPAIVPVHELGRDADGLPYFTMKRLAGTTLAARLAESGPLQPLLRAFVDVCFAIELAHTREVVHRDLKPSNIMLGDYGDVYVLDWGVARVLGSAPAPAPNLPLDTPAPDATATGSILGTPGYMAPEQMRGEQVGTAADVYALGTILFEILAGETLHPLGGDAFASTLGGTVVCSPAARAPSRQIAPELDAVCIAALAGDPAARPSARELATRVQAYLDGDRDLDHRRALAVASVAQARDLEAAGDRVRALRAIGRAVALDPESRDATELAGSLILTQPREIPAEALAEVAEQERAIDRSRQLRGVRAYLMIWLLLPLALFGRVADWRLLVALIAAGTAMAGMVRLHVAKNLSWWVLGFANLAFGVLFERLAGPLILTPMFACVIAMAVGMQLRTRPGAALLFVALVLGLPVVLELTGVMARTWWMTYDGLLVRGAVFATHDTVDVIGLFAGSVGICLIVVGYALALDRSRRTAQRDVAVQAWLLRQLVRRRD
jgi:serine/threonine-protein kinase